jgi:hypothetical protein
MYDGTNTATLDAVFATMRATHLAYRWGVSSQMTVWNVTDNATKTASFDGAIGTAAATVGLGYTAATLNANGYLGNVCLDPSTSRCYR